MKTPIEQILEGFDGLQWEHFIPVLIVLIPIILIGMQRRRNPIKSSKHRVWVKGKGLQPAWKIDTRDEKAVQALETAYRETIKKK